MVGLQNNSISYFHTRIFGVFYGILPAMFFTISSHVFWCSDLRSLIFSSAMRNWCLNRISFFRSKRFFILFDNLNNVFSVFFSDCFLTNSLKYCFKLPWCIRGNEKVSTLSRFFYISFKEDSDICVWRDFRFSKLITCCYLTSVSSPPLHC